MVKFLFSVHTITAKQSNRQDGGRAGARAMDLPARSFDLARPGVARAPPLATSWPQEVYEDRQTTVQFRATYIILFSTCFKMWHKNEHNLYNIMQ